MPGLPSPPGAGHIPEYAYTTTAAVPASQRQQPIPRNRNPRGRRFHPTVREPFADYREDLPFAGL